MYQILYHKSVLKNLKKIIPKKRKSIINKIEKLAKSPFIQNTNLKKLQNTPYLYRLRIGNLRVIYEINKKNKKLIIWKVKPRSSAYSK